MYVFFMDQILSIISKKQLGYEAHDSLSCWIAKLYYWIVTWSTILAGDSWVQVMKNEACDGCVETLKKKAMFAIF